MGFEEQIISKDNYPCIFPKPKVVYCLYRPSNISSHSETSGAKTKHKAKRLLAAFWYCFLNKFPNFHQEIEEKRSISKFVRQIGVIGCEWALSADNVCSLLDHMSRFHQSRVRRNI